MRPARLRPRPRPGGPTGAGAGHHAAHRGDAGCAPARGPPARAAGRAAAAAGADPEPAELLRAAHSIAGQAASGDDCSAAEQAMILPRLVNSVLRPLAE